MKQLLVAAIALLLMASCKKETPGSKIDMAVYADSVVFYNGNSQEVYITATADVIATGTRYKSFYAEVTPAEGSHTFYRDNLVNGEDSLRGSLLSDSLQVCGWWSADYSDIDNLETECNK